MKTKTHPGLIGPVDSHRRERLMKLADLIGSNRERKIELNFPDWHDQTKRDLDANDLPLGGPQTVLFGLPALLSEHSKLLSAGVPMINSTRFQDLDIPVLDRSLEATFDGSSVDIGGNGVSVALLTPKRVSAYVEFSRQLRVQNPLLDGEWLESQLMSAIGRALDKNAIVGDGIGKNPLGILNDGDILTNTRANTATDTLADLAAMKRTIADAFGEVDPEDYFWISDTATRETLETTEGIGSPIWSGVGPMGLPGYASVHAPASTLVLAQRNGMAFADWNKLEVENVLDVEQSKEGFQTVLVSGFFDFVTVDPAMICKAVNP